MRDMRKFKTESKKLLDLMTNSIYTNREIFLRELISNASDAIDKLYLKSLTDASAQIDQANLAITVTPNKDARTLTISDNGIGMTAEELEKNLGTIAHSGSLGFKQEMEKKDLGDGRILYSYGAPTEDGIYIVPYIIRSTTDGSVLFYVSVRHLGMTPQGFPGVDVMTDEETKYSFRPEAQQVTTTPRDGGITESFDEQVNARTLKALRDVGQMGSAKIIFPREGGSNDDRVLTATECTQIEHMVELFDLWRQKN